ncbi:hypothetical protein DM860_012130 [Cuscuta australis]|uniref:Uncharacterized protein n=1 Tax=Cuscuta australis TaxID=267555 RepID=A0A328D938_9ASTE|nr:hypothetical protein DM860_012130 [Cuscuta australis]
MQDCKLKIKEEFLCVFFCSCNSCAMRIYKIEYFNYGNAMWQSTCIFVGSFPMSNLLVTWLCDWVYLKELSAWICLFPQNVFPSLFSILVVCFLSSHTLQASKHNALVFGFYGWCCPRAFW